MCRRLSYILILYFIWNNGLETLAQDENQCHLSSCQNGGTCENGVNDYTCHCQQKTALVPESDGSRPFVTGYSGRNCEFDIDECLVKPSICLNGGRCKNEDGSFSCLCSMSKPGIFYSGLHCEMETSYCQVSPDVINDLPACKNNGTCEPLPLGYLCHCPSGFTGKRCEVDVDRCASNPCRNNGTCVDGISGYTCSCSYGTTGTNCETDIHVCSPNQCLNGGVCHEGNSTGYVCDCAGTGFIGKLCETVADVTSEGNVAIQHGAVWCLIILFTIIISQVKLS